MKGYEADSLIQMGDDERIIRQGPVFDTPRDARWYTGQLNAAGIPAWVTPVEVEPGPNALNGEV